MERTFKIASVGFIAIAFFFVWRQDTDAVFVAGVLGVACFFLAMRYEIEERRRRRDGEPPEPEKDKQ